MRFDDLGGQRCPIQSCSCFIHYCSSRGSKKFYDSRDHAFDMYAQKHGMASGSRLLSGSGLMRQ